MYISLNWISDYVDLKGVNLKELINKFTLSCAEVEAVYEKGKDIQNVVTGKILSSDSHPNSKKLKVLKVDVGSDVLDIVCGAPNANEGAVVPVALMGGKVGDLNISKAKVAGIDSYGMCCSGQELGISDDDEGLLILDKNTPIGVDIKSLFDIDDVVFEVDNKSLTNRPDMWGHYGIAREIATLLKKELVAPSLWEEKSALPAVNVKVDAQDCFRYCAGTLTNITKKVSPVNMQIRLYYCGMRKINFLTDLTNYVMLEFGQPMHAFDNNIVKDIHVTNLSTATKFTTLDEKVRELPAGAMVINSNNNIMAIAGIMGGLTGSVTDNTTSVFLESACFDGYSVRKTSSALNLRTESSARYEKSIDPELAIISLKRYIYLLKKYDADIIVSSAFTDVYNYTFPKLSIPITKKYIDDLIGVNIAESKIIDILSRLEFEVLIQGVGDYRVQVPSFRATKDIQGKADIVEEIARMYGYDNIQPKSVAQIVQPNDKNHEIHIEYAVKKMLAMRYNFHEIHSYLWYDHAINKQLDINATSHLKIINSIQKENDNIRSSLIPVQLKNVIDNINDYSNFKIFEIGRVVKQLDSDGNAIESKCLTLTIASKTQRDKLLISLKNIIQYMFDVVIKADIKIRKAMPNVDYLHPVNYYEIVADNVSLGMIAFIHPRVEKKIDKKVSIATAELDFSSILKLKRKATVFEKVSKFQKCQLDFSFSLSPSTLYQDIEKIAYSIKVDYDYQVELIDIFDVSDSVKTYTIRYIMCSDCRTLTGDELEHFHKSVIKAFAEKGINLRDIDMNCPM